MSGTRARPAPVRLTRRRLLRRLPRPGLRTLAVVLAVLALAGGGWVWLRNSSLVAVQHVTIVGVSGRDAASDPRCAGLGRAQHDHAQREDGRAADGRGPVPGGQAAARLHRLPASHAHRRGGAGAGGDRLRRRRQRPRVVATARSCAAPRSRASLPTIALGGVAGRHPRDRRDAAGRPPAGRRALSAAAAR